jgi:hypothetical protein
MKKKASLKENSLQSPSRPQSGAQTSDYTQSHIKDRISNIMGDVNRSIQAHSITKQRKTNLKR